MTLTTVSTTVLYCDYDLPNGAIFTDT